MIETLLIISYTVAALGATSFLITIMSVPSHEEGMAVVPFIQMVLGLFVLGGIWLVKLGIYLAQNGGVQ